MDGGGLPDVAICVVTYNSADLVEGLIRSLPAGAEGTSWQLVVVDNASSDDTLDQVARWAPDAVVVDSGRNAGYAAGINHAVVAAGPRDAYLILNADVRLTPGCLATMIGALSSSVGIVVPRLDDARGELIWSMRREPTVLRAWADAVVGAERAGRWPRLGEMVTHRSLYESGCATDWAEGSTQLISRACWDACGPWDESYFLYSEETEYNLRARDHGFTTWFEPAAVAVHLEGGSAGSPRQWSLVVANRVKLVRQRKGRIVAACFWLAVSAREASRAVLGKKTSRAAIRDLVRPARLREQRGPEWLAGVRV
jgi:GT2 family glycosyltransferase